MSSLCENALVNFVLFNYRLKRLIDAISHSMVLTGY